MAGAAAVVEDRRDVRERQERSCGVALRGAALERGAKRREQERAPGEARAIPARCGHDIARAALEVELRRYLREPRLQDRLRRQPPGTVGLIVGDHGARVGDVVNVQADEELASAEPLYTRDAEIER